MRVLHVIPSVSSKRGGPSVAVRRMAEGVAALGATVDIATTDDDGAGHLDVPLGVPVEARGVRVWHFRRQSHFYAFSWPLTRWLARHVANYDVVHIHALFSYAMIPAALSARRAGVPYIVRPLGTLNEYGVTQRRPWLKRLSLGLIERPLLRGAAVVHYTAEQERIEAARSGITFPHVVLPLGIELEGGEPPPPDAFARRFPEVAGRRLLLFLSRLDRKKGLDLLLPAFAEARKQFPDAMLVIAGSGEADYEAKLRAEAAALGLEGAICWTGFLEGEAKREALAAAELLVLPSYSENFGVAVVEAMAAGLPVIVSDQVAIHREISEADAGVVVPCAVEPLAEAMIAALAEPERAAAQGTQARDLAQRLFSLEACARQLHELYQTLNDRPALPTA